MPADPTFDPSAEWQKFIQQTEQAINAMSGQFTGTQEFASMLSQFGMLTQAMQRMFSDHMEKVLQNLNLPTQKQVSDLADRLHAIEGRLDELKLAMDKLVPREERRPRPRRTLKPPA